MSIREQSATAAEESRRRILHSREDDSIDLVELFYFLLDRWYLIVACTLIGAVLLGGFAKLFIKPTYQSTAKLYVVATSGDSVVDLTDLNIGTSLTNDYRELILSYPVLERVTAALGLDMTSDQLRSLVSLTNPTNTRVLAITVTCGDPELAASIANTIAGVAQEYLPETMSTVRPNVAQVAKVPTHRYAPSISRFAMLGGILGLLLSVCWLTVRMLTDDTIHSSEDWEKTFDVPLLTVIAEYEVPESSGASTGTQGRSDRHRQNDKHRRSMKRVPATKPKARSADTRASAGAAEGRRKG